MYRAIHPAFTPNDLAGNALELCELFGLKAESEVSRIVSSFTITSDSIEETIEVREGKYKTALLLLYFHTLSSSLAGEFFALGNQRIQLITMYYGAELIRDAIGNDDTKHTSLRAMLVDGAKAKIALNPNFRGELASGKRLESIIEEGWDMRAELNTEVSKHSFIRTAVDTVLEGLDRGTMRVAEKIGGEWRTNEWIKKAVLLSFRLSQNQLMGFHGFRGYDKVPSKFDGWTPERFQAAGFRVVPPAAVRHSAFVGNGVVLMPSFVNVGAYIDEGTMIDTWATVGSCAQIGKNCHISGGVGIGGVLEPIQASPVIIEDNCFVGARSEIVEGVVIEENSVIGMGVFLGQSTPIYNRLTGKVTYGRIPAGSVVVSGSLPKEDEAYNLYCAVIVKQVDAKTRAKTSINDLLRP